MRRHAHYVEVATRQKEGSGIIREEQGAKHPAEVAVGLGSFPRRFLAMRLVQAAAWPSRTLHARWLHREHGQSGSAPIIQTL